MTEPFDPVGDSALSAQGDAHSTAGDSFGAMLRRARQARGISAAEIGARLQLRERTVLALENEDLVALPQSAYVRGFARKYAGLVGVDQRELLAALDRRLQPERPLQVGDGSTSNPVHVAAREHFSRMAVIGGALLSLAVFAIAGWYSMRPVSAPAPIAVPAAPARDGSAATPPTRAADEAAAGAAQAPNASAPGSTNSTNVVSPPATGPAAPAPSRPAPAVPATALVFDFRERTWVRIVQSDGKVLMAQNNEAGTQQIIDGKPPYEVVIGNARGVQLEYRGEPVEVEPLATRDNVARLRLN